MRISYKLTDLTGAQCAEIMRAAIKTDGIGFDEGGSATLIEETSESGHPRLVWQTCWSQFRYVLINPTSDMTHRPGTGRGGANMIYEGASQGFLKQNLLPAEFKGPTGCAGIVGGSMTDAFADKIDLPRDAADLVRVYQLLVQVSRVFPDRLGYGGYVNDCVRVVRAKKRLIDQKLDGFWIDSRIAAYGPSVQVSFTPEFNRGIRTYADFPAQFGESFMVEQAMDYMRKWTDMGAVYRQKNGD